MAEQKRAFVSTVSVQLQSNVEPFRVMGARNARCGEHAPEKSQPVKKSQPAEARAGGVFCEEAAGMEGG